MKIWLIEVWRAWRASLRRPGFLLLASAVLALGLGASAVAFDLIDQVLLKPLPLPQASRVLAAGQLRPHWLPQVSARQYAALQKLDGVQSIGVLTFVTPSVNIVSHGVPQRAAVAYADRGLLPTLGLQPQLGRNFAEGEDDAHVVMLTHAFWKARYASRPAAIGQVLKIEGVPHTIIGILPEAFAQVDTGSDIVLPTAVTPGDTGEQLSYLAIIRLADGATPAAVGAQVEARLRAEAAGRAEANRNGHDRFGVMDYQAALHVLGAPVLMLFQASALLVLLIAIVNEVNLLLMRALARQRDSSVRSALGAHHWRVAAPLLAESLLVGLLGAALGVLLTLIGLAVLRGILPQDFTGGELRLGGHTLLLTMLVSLAATLSSALLGAWRARGMASFDDLREGGRSGSTRHQGRFSRALVTAQVVLTAVLLCFCGIFLHRAWDEAHQHWGFDAAGVVTVTLEPTQVDYPDARAVVALSQRLIERIRQWPGVLEAAAATSLPMYDFFGSFSTPAHAPGQTAAPVVYRAAGTDYFRVFGIHLQRGRGFTVQDRRGGEAVAVINQTMAERMYGGQALGREVQVDNAADPGRPWTARIVGVVDDTFQRGDGEQKFPELYVPLEQMPDALMANFRSKSSLHLALRVRGDIAGYGKPLRDIVAEVAPEQPQAQVHSMRAIVEEASSGSLMGVWICGVLAAMALLLAAAGLYAVMSVAVATRQHELGVRSALGASPARLAISVLRSGMNQVLAGLVLGLMLAAGFGRLLLSAFVQLGSNATLDPWVVAGVCVVLLTFGLLACLAPAMRAGRVQPMRVLQGD